MSWLQKPFKELEPVEIYRSDKNLIKSDVQALTIWCESRSDLPAITELQAILFLHNSSYDVNKAKIFIENYLVIKSNNPKLFGSRTLNCPLFKNAAECILMAPLSACTPSGDMIVVGRLMQNDLAKYTGEGHIRLFDVTTLMYLHQNGPVNGVQLVADMANAGFAHVMKYDAHTVNIFMKYLHEAMPIRITRIHFIHMNYIVSKILVLTRPLLPKDIGDAIIVHSNLEQLHAHIPKDLLPEDYGGNSDSLEVLQNIQSWWEVPSIAHFCSLFRTAFNLLDFDIEDLEEALLTDGTEESSWLQDLIVRLLSGCLPNNEISTFNYQMFLRRLFRQKCQEHDLYNPFNTDIDFQLLPLRTKVDILHALCDFRLDAEDVLDQLKNLEADSLRVEPLGYDGNDSAYWYFYGTRLYREDYTTKNNKKKAVWQVICFTEDDWLQLTKKLKKSGDKAERQLHLTLSENFLPELPRLFKEKENLARKRLLENLPRRTSSRLKKTEADHEKEVEKKDNVKEEKLKRDKEEEVKRKDLETRRQEAYERRSKLKDKVKDEDVEYESDKMSNTRSKKSKTKEKTNFKDEKSSKNSKHNKKREKQSDNETKLSSSKPTTIGRQTNNSLSAVTGQILIEPPKNPNKKKLKTSQVFRQTDEDLQTGMHKILDFVKNHEDAWPFTDPVEEEYAPNYYSIIRKPMDLQRMEERLDSGYYKTFDKFRSDFLLIVDNCKLYNGAENEYTEMVDNLLRVFEKATVKYLDQLSSSDDEIAIEFTGEKNSKTKGKEKKSDEPSSNNARRKPMLAAQTDRKRHRSESEGSIEEVAKEAPTRPSKVRKQDQSETEISDVVNKGSKKMKKTKLVVKEKSVSKKSKLKRVAKKEKEKEKDKDKEKDRKKKAKSKPFSRSPSMSPPPSDSPPPSSPDSRFDYCPKSLGKRKQYEEFTDCDNSPKERKNLFDVFEEKKPKKTDPLVILSKPKDKHNKLRETIEKLKAKSEIKFNAEPDRPKENDKIIVESEHNTIDSEELKCSNTFAAKPASHMDALSIATEQTLKDINKWLDDTPKFAEFSSASNSPSYAGLEELDVLTNKLDPPPGKKPATKKDPTASKDSTKKKPFRDPSKFFKRREIQRTIDRLQPGKSKGNLITNVQNANKTADEPFPLGPLAKLKDAKNSLIVKTDTNAPKLSLGSVLDSFGKHKFAEKEKAKPQADLDEPKTEEKETATPVNADVKKEDEGSGATPNLSAWFKAFGAPKVQPATKKNEAKEEKEETQPVARQRRISTGSSVSERSSFSQDMDSPRVGMDERGAYPAPYPSPMHRSPSGASPVMASPRPDISPKASYSTINGQIRVGFYQDTVSNKSSPDKSCSPKENSQSQSPYPHYSEHIYTPNTTENSYYSPYYTHVPNYSSTNPTPPYNAEGNYYYEGSNKSVPNYTANSPASNQSSPAPAPSSVSPNPNVYSPHSPTVLPQHSPTVLPQHSPTVLPLHSPTVLPQQPEEEKMADKVFPVKKRAYSEQEQPIANQRFEIDPRLTQQIELKKNSEVVQQKEYVHQNIPDPKNHHHHHLQHNNALQQEDLYYQQQQQQQQQQHQNKIDMSKYTNMGYTGPDYPATSAISVPSTTQSKVVSHEAHARYANPNLVGYKNPVETASCQARSSANVARTMASTMANLSHIVDQFGGDERMMVGLQNMQNAGGFYADKGHLLNKPMPNNAIFSQANMAALQSYNQSMQVSTASLYNRQMTDLQNQSIMQGELKANQQMHAVAEKKSKKRKAGKNAASMDSQQQQSSLSNQQGFQSYAGLKSANAALEPSAISLKTSSVVPGSAFNFGPTPTGLGIGSAIYGDKDGYPNFLDDFRSAATTYYKESSRPAHQNANPQSYPFLGPPGPPPHPGQPQSRSAYQMAGPFMQNAQAQLMNTGSPLYQHYLQQAGVLNQGLLPPPPPPPHGAYPPGYHPALSMRQPYDSMNRPPWL